VAATIRVRGVTYRNPDEGYVAAEELEHHADTLAENLRRSGKEGEADTVQDRGRADAERLRTWARERETSEAEQTDQPADRPSETPRSGNRGGGRRRASRSSSSARRRSSSAAFTPRTRRIIAQTGIPAATSSVTALALQVAGLSLGIAFLTLLLSRRGVQAFGDLAGGAGHALDRIILPVDPLAPRPKLAAQGASYSATAAARAQLAHRPRRPVARVPAVAGGVQ
jgi:hypothetical protein